jgi:Rrf2 family nitric oxide-sensitive transcriptional repressor
MQLTLFSDYSLRIALYLATHPQRLVSVGEVSRAYGISHAHLVKVVQRLTALGIVEPVRGRSGGLRLGTPANQIRIGELVRRTEPHFDLVECFDRSTNTCPIAPACALKGALAEANRAFLEALDRYTLADLMGQPGPLIQLWTRRARVAPRKRE